MTNPETVSFETVYADLAARLRALAIGKFRVPPQVAEELVHDVFAQYLAQEHEHVRSAERYLFVSICNASKSYWRRRRTEDINRVEWPQDEPADASSSVDDLLASRGALGVTLAHLPERCRDVLHRFYVEEESAREIATAIDKSEAYVWRLLHNCRKRGREIYDSISRVNLP